MGSLPKKALERFRNVVKFQKILLSAKDRDLNESNTVSIITDILSDVFGYDKYVEITSELAVKCTYCDLALKVNGKIQFLIEAKAVGIDLKDNHLKQIIDYGANYGVSWVILTNGISWNVYKIKFQKPIGQDLVCSFNFLDLNWKKADDQEKLYLIAKEGISKNVRNDFYERTQIVNRFILSALLMSNNIASAIKKEIKRLSPGIKVDDSEIQRLLITEVIKRDVIEGEEAEKAQSRVKRFYNKVSKKEKRPGNEANSSMSKDDVSKPKPDQSNLSDSTQTNTN
jgi:hypothetical protein